MSTNYIVRYGSTRIVAEFSSRNSPGFGRNTDVIVRSDRGVEWGQILCTATERTRQYLSGRNHVGRILRAATQEDHRIRDRLKQQEREQFDGCREMILERKLQMDLVDVEQVFGGERLVLYYLAEKRVDFRELVKALAKRFKSRIQMMQIGVRDEAKLLADYGDCGKPVCCNTYLTEMPPVSMKMAKLQKATLDPTKISGRCGRLKCCLRYEFDTYEEYRKELPRVGTTVITKTGQGKVIGQDILARKILILTEENRRMMIDSADVVTVVKKSASKTSRPSKDDAGVQSESKAATAVVAEQAGRESIADHPETASDEKQQDSDEKPTRSRRRSRRRRGRRPGGNDQNNSEDGGVVDAGRNESSSASTEASNNEQDADPNSRSDRKKPRSRGDRRRRRRRNPSDSGGNETGGESPE